MALFTNIPQEEGVLATEEALDEREIQIIHTEYICVLLPLPSFWKNRENAIK